MISRRTLIRALPVLAIPADAPSAMPEKSINDHLATMTDDEQAFYLVKLAAKAAGRANSEKMTCGFDAEKKMGFFSIA